MTCLFRSRVNGARVKQCLTFSRDSLFKAVFWVFVSLSFACYLWVTRDWLASSLASLQGACFGLDEFTLLTVWDAFVVLANLLLAVFVVRDGCLSVACFSDYLRAKRNLDNYDSDDIGIVDLIYVTSNEDSPGRGRSWRALRSLLRDNHVANAFLGSSVDQKMMSLCARSELVSGLFGGPSREAFLGAYKQMQRRRSVAYDSLLEFAGVARQNGVRYALMKGMATEWLVYPEGGYRDIGDIDILVHPDDAALAHALLMEMGYKQAVGPTSVADRRQGRALAALALVSQQDSGANDVVGMVRRHQYSDQFAPYRKEDCITIELHDSLRGFPAGSAAVMLQEHVRDGAGFKMTDAVGSFVMLLTSAYQNSESFPSVLCDHSATLRDFYELKIVFESNRTEKFWREVRDSVAFFGLEAQWARVRYDYEDLYGNGAIPVALRDIDSMSSRWRVGIVERLRNPQSGRAAALAVFREGLLNEAKSITAGLDKGSSCVVSMQGASGVRFGLNFDARGAWMVWRVPGEYSKSDAVAFECACFPLSADFRMTSIKVTLSYRDASYLAFAHETERFNEDLFLRDVGVPCTVESNMQGGCEILSIRIDDVDPALASGLHDGLIAFQPGVFRRVAGGVFWRIGARAVHDECHLDGVYMLKQSVGA
jgi:hypothetical protein